MSLKWRGVFVLLLNLFGDKGIILYVDLIGTSVRSGDVENLGTSIIKWTMNGETP